MIEVTKRRERRYKLLNDFEETRRMPSIERGSTRSLSVENSLWRRLWNCCNTDNKMMTDKWEVEQMFNNKDSKSRA
jgi:hypothetical protein